MKKFIVALTGLFLTVSLCAQVSQDDFNVQFGKILKEDQKLSALIKEIKSQYTDDQIKLILAAKSLGSVANVYEASEAKIKELVEGIKVTHKRVVNLLTNLYGGISKINMMDFKQRIKLYFAVYALNPTECEIACMGQYFGCVAACLERDNTPACWVACDNQKGTCINNCPQ